MANSADPDQLASSEANWSGSTLFANAGISGLSMTRVKHIDHIDIGVNLLSINITKYLWNIQVKSVQNP